MLKIGIGFVLFAALAIFILSKGGDIDLSGEKHGADAMHSEPDKAAPAAPAANVAPAVPAAAAPAPAKN